jgi:hypothetical protein
MRATIIGATSFLSILVLLVPCSQVMAKDEACVTCHEGVSPGLVKDWQTSKHSQDGTSGQC